MLSSKLHVQSGFRYKLCSIAEIPLLEIKSLFYTSQLIIMCSLKMPTPLLTHSQFYECENATFLLSGSADRMVHLYNIKVRTYILHTYIHVHVNACLGESMAWFYISGEKER